MSLPMTHDLVQAALAVEALDALDGPERTEVRAHVAACSECAAQLAALRDSAASLAFAAPSRRMDRDGSDRMRRRLLARAAADARPEPAAPGVVSIRRTPAAAPAPPARSGWLAAAAVAALLLGTAGYAAMLQGRVDSLSRGLASAESQEAQLNSALSEREQVLAGLTGKDVRVIELASAGTRAPGGRMFWDPSTDRWTFFAHDLPATPQGREYQLWLITPGRKLSAGTFRPGPRGDATVKAQYALPQDSLQAIAVTEEPAGGLPQPSGPIVIVGTVSSE